MKHTKEPWIVIPNTKTIGHGTRGMSGLCVHGNFPQNCWAGMCRQDFAKAQQAEIDRLAALNAEFLSELSEYRAIRDRLAAQDKAGTLPDDYSIYIGLLENRLSEQRNLNSAMEQQRDELLAAAEIFRDSVLHQRHSMADNGMTNDQVNDVLGLFDDTLGEAIAKAGVK